MTTNEIIAQILMTFSILILLSYTVFKVSRRTILICNMVINLLQAIHYFLMGPEGATGGACSLICVLMVLVFYFKGKNRFLSGLWIPAFFIVAFIVFGILTFETPFSVIPIIGNTLLVVAFWRNTEVAIKGTCIVVAALWVVYNAILLSYVGLIGQVLSFVLNIVYVARYLYFARKDARQSKSEEKAA